MKIVLLSDGFPSKGRPIYIFVEQLVHKLVDKGNEVTVIAFQSITKALVYKEKLLPWVNVHSTNSGNTFNVIRPYTITFGSGRRFLYKCFKFIERIAVHLIIRRTSPEILYGHFWHCADKLKKSAIRYHIPLFVACGEGDNALETLNNNLSGKERKQLIDAVCGVISVSTENMHKCISYKLVSKENIVVLPNCVDSNIFYPGRNDELRSKLGLIPEDFLVIFVGSFIKRKGPDRLCQALDLIASTNLKAVFIGKTMGSDAVEPQYEGIVYKGIVDHSDLPNYLRAADLFVLPTLKEGCSNAIVEALATAIPVVSSDRSFNYDILNPYNSILVQPDDVSAIAQAILEFMYNKDKYRSVKEYLLLEAGSYSLDLRVSKILEFIKKQLKIYNENISNSSHI